MLPNYYEKIVDINSGEETIRPFTDEEIVKIKAEEEKTALIAAENAEKLAQKKAIWEKMGLSESEVMVLLS